MSGFNIFQQKGAWKKMSKKEIIEKRKDKEMDGYEPSLPRVVVSWCWNILNPLTI